MTEPRDLKVSETGEITLRVPAGDLQVIALTTR
jgi:hypothetical protein